MEEMVQKVVNLFTLTRFDAVSIKKIIFNRLSYNEFLIDFHETNFRKN